MELNIFGNPLIPCCTNPATGYFRDGFCRTISEDTGTHTVCAIVTQEFLNYSASRGNDLMTPIPHWNFPGLQADPRKNGVSKCRSRTGGTGIEPKVHTEKGQ